MLFNSYSFIFIFLPVTLFGLFLIEKLGKNKIVIFWLLGASLFFYGWWNPYYLTLLVLSIIFNFVISHLIRSQKNRLFSKIILISGIFVNLSTIAYYKYSNFFIDNLNVLVDSNIIFYEVILPLGISFFTFQQITFLVDSFHNKIKHNSFLQYSLFVVFFPQLIAGPIVHHKEIFPQFSSNIFGKITSNNLAIGITIFSLGLFKKVIIADNLALYSSPVFAAADVGILLTFFEAWGGSLAYTFQLYFDFSGYSDMAIGLARMFGIILPVNFYSPYKSTSIIDFWRNWHITLSRFLKYYVYIPIGGNKKGEVRRYSNLMITMILGGIWHGAGWTFLLWGALHGFYLIINHLWRIVFINNVKTKIGSILSWVITFLAIVFAWVPFRASDLQSAKAIFEAMIGVNGFLLPESYLVLLNKLPGFGDFLMSIGFKFGVPDLFEGINQIILILISLLIVLLMPNVNQFMSNDIHNKNNEQKDVKIKHYGLRFLIWRPSLFYSILTALIFTVAVFGMSENSEFLYFQF